MKILVLGGCGQEGAIAIRELVKSGDVSSVVVGDIDTAKADRLKERLGDKLSTLYVDANCHQTLVKAMSSVDLVVSFVGPYYQFGVKILQAAIEAKKDFLDINDDYDATADALALNDAAKDAGITAIIGMGATPGLSNMLAIMGAKKLDEVDDIHFRWKVSITDVENPDTSAIMGHMLHICAGTHPQFLDGKWADIEGMSGSETVHFPMLGEVEVYYVGHPEPVTLPRYIKGLKNVTCKGGYLGLDDLVRDLRGLGLLNEDYLNVRGRKVAPRDLAIELVNELPEQNPDTLPPPYSGGYVTVEGRKAGNSIKYTYRLVKPNRMGPCTGIPVCIVALMLARSQIRETGVMAPEGCIDPQLFMVELAKHGFVFTETEEIVRVI